MIQLCCQFSDTDDGFPQRADDAVALLVAQPSCRSLRLARSTEDSGRWLLTAEFDTFPGYRAALSPMDVRLTVIPFLSEADPAISGVFEVRTAGDHGAVRQLETVVDHATDHATDHVTDRAVD